MAINKEESGKINYKGKTSYHKKRNYRVEEPKKKTDKQYLPESRKPEVVALRNKFSDLKKKATKLDAVIDSLSMAMSIPIDVNKQPRISYAVNQLDPSSKGEYLSYTLYRDILNQQELGQSNTDLDWLIENMTDDPYSNSDLLYNNYIEGAQKYTQIPPIKTSIEGPNMWNVYGNMMLNNITNWNENEYHIRQIVNWAQGWLYGSTDPAYIPWTFKEDMKKKIMEYDNLDGLLGAYSDLTNNVGTAFDSLKNPLSLPMDLWDSLNGKADSDNNFFNQINEIFSMSYGADLICCFVAWAGGLDMKTLYALRLILQLAANGIKLELSSLFNSLISVVNAFTRNIILGQIIALIELLIQTVTDPLYRWLNTNNNKWQRLFLCTPIDEAINIYVIGGIEKVQDILEDKIQQFMKKVEIDTYFEEQKTEKIKKNKVLQTLIDLLDTIIAAVGKSTLCGQEIAATVGGVSRFSDSYKAGPSWTFSYAKEENPNEYNSFMVEKTVVEEESDSEGNITIEEKTTSHEFLGTDGFDYETESTSIDKCLKKTSQDNVFSVQEWMEDIISKASEEN